MVRRSERAAQLAGGHEVLLSTSLDAPYIQALFYLKPDPLSYAGWDWRRCTCAPSR